MNLLGCTFLLLLGLQPSSAYNQDALDHVLRTIEYLASVHGGVFSCIFYDLSQGSHPGVWNDVLTSARLDHIVVKYVFDESFVAHHDTPLGDPRNPPAHPSMLLINPGRDDRYLGLPDVETRIHYFLLLLNPFTKVLIFADRTNLPVFHKILYFVNNNGFNNIVFIDSFDMHSLHCNLQKCRSRSRMPHPMNWFLRRSMEGRTIHYITDEPRTSFAWNAHWLAETARFLDTNVVEYKHNCKGSDDELDRCFRNIMDTPNLADIVFRRVVRSSVGTLAFRELYTIVPWVSKIVVPRDRPVNAAELMSMPFSWQVWLLLSVILVATEVTQRLRPEMFRNDPIMLAVCGYERHNLHQAGRWEKIFFLSLIILMFFMSNAYETKIVSLMVNKPSIQRIKTIDDFKHTEVRFHEDLENDPHFLNDSIIGDLVVQGKRRDLFEAIPGGAVFWDKEFIDVYYELAFDYNRMESFFVVLDQEYFTGIELYIAKYRSPYLEAFRYTHITLFEAGLFVLWQRQWKDEMRSAYVGRRPREDAGSQSDLSFEDMLPAWLALGIGFCLSILGFTGELVARPFDSWWSQVRKRIAK